MPIVLSYDDPALVATLASGAARYAQNQDQLDLALRYASLNRGGSTRYNFPPDWHDIGSADRAPQGQPADQMVAVQETDALGRIFNTWKPASVVATEAKSGNAQGYMLPQQRRLMEYVDQMEAGGHVGPDEAIRMRARITTGENPFADPTVNEQIRTRASQKGELTPYQQASIALQAERLANSEEQTRYRQKRDGILQQIRQQKDIEKDFTRSLDERNKAKEKISQLTDELLSLGNEPAPESGSGVIDWLQRVATGQSPPSDGAGSTSVQPAQQQRPQSRAVKNADGTIQQIGPDGREMSRLTPSGVDPHPYPFDLAAKTRDASQSNDRGDQLVTLPDGGAVLRARDGSNLRTFSRDEILDLVRKYGSAAAARQAVLNGQER
ncbi:hypothetical protein [Fontivita pretiosa]|uniref:hypothetical protein n=1 Tax=Fontivita pretiosa TaxID=2989684 RepID=UPI003D186BA2